MSQAVQAPVDVPRRLTPERTRVDRAYRGIALGAGSVTLVVLFLIGLFLLLRAAPTFQQNGISFLTGRVWAPDDIGHHAGALTLIYGTIEIAVIALVLAMPVSVMTALFLTEYVPAGMRRPFTSLLDLLAAIPSLIYGIWGFFFLEPHLIPVSQWLANNLGFIPIFQVSGDNFAGSPFIAGVLVALMLLPTATSVMREVFSQAPPGEKEAALALGGSRWRMIRAVVIPFGRGGIIGGSMLALGRALGESISVAIVIASAFDTSIHILETGANSIGAHIANRFGDATPTYGLPALMGVGLILFLMTLLVNTAASLIVRRSRSGAGVEI
jgi:phosphate transport system permease protein